MLKTIFQTAGVLRICDVLTGQPVAGNGLQFRLPQSLQVMPKGDGYFILLGGKITAPITIEGPMYQPYLLTQTEQEVCYLWLTPKQQSRHCVRQLQLQAGATCYGFCSMNMKLLQDKPADQRCIQLFMDTPMLLEGRTLVLTIDGAIHLATVVEKQEQEQGYLLDRDLPACSKIKTLISVAYPATADDKGVCTLLLPDENAYTIVDDQAKMIDQ